MRPRLAWPAEPMQMAFDEAAGLAERLQDLASAADLGHGA